MFINYKQIEMAFISDTGLALTQWEVPPAASEVSALLLSEANNPHRKGWALGKNVSAAHPLSHVMKGNHSPHLTDWQHLMTELQGPPFTSQRGTQVTKLYLGITALHQGSALEKQELEKEMPKNVGLAWATAGNQTEQLLLPTETSRHPVLSSLTWYVLA